MHRTPVELTELPDAQAELFGQSSQIPRYGCPFFVLLRRAGREYPMVFEVRPALDAQDEWELFNSFQVEGCMQPDEVQMARDEPETKPQSHQGQQNCHHVSSLSCVDVSVKLVDHLSGEKADRGYSTELAKKTA